MRIEDDGLLALFRAALRCEFCGRVCPGASDPHHIFSRGAGRLDIRWNLVALCRWCHGESHAGRAPKRWRLLIIAARREGVSVREIVEEVYRLRRLPK